METLWKLTEHIVLFFPLGLKQWGWDLEYILGPLPLGLYKILKPPTLLKFPMKSHRSKAFLRYQFEIGNYKSETVSSSYLPTLRYPN